MGNEWREVTLGDVCDFRAGSVFKLQYQGQTTGDYPFVKVSDMNLQVNQVHIHDANNWVTQKVVDAISAKPLPPGTVVFAKIGEALKHNRLRITVHSTIVDNNMMGAIPKINVVDPRFLFYGMHQFDFGEVAYGTALPYLTMPALAELPFSLPPLPEQRAIAHILGTLDDKIELNRRLNQTLEAMARAIFQDWFVDFGPVHAKLAGQEPYLPPELWALFPDRLAATELGEAPEGWGVKALAEIADFRNGLALQKFRPGAGEGRLPVLKIAQLRSGQADGGEWATENIAPDCIVEDGDVIFSWSGSLMVKVWCGGQAALNQHLFKVTSPDYPKWFYLYCTENHLPGFQDIASDKATTMGHIKREHLNDAKCVVPSQTLLAAANDTFTNLLSQQISANLQSRTLAALRDTMLPRLVSGEVGVEEVKSGKR